MIRSHLFVFTLLTSPLLWAQDACRDEFVSCVASSGDILACRSVYTNCEAEQGNDLLAQPAGEAAANNRELQLVPEIVEMGSALSSIRLTISNPTGQPIQVGNATYPVTCADGSTDRAVFFMDALVDAGVTGQRAGSDQIVCVGAGGAVAIQQEQAEVAGLASVSPTLEYEYPCANGQYRWITLTYAPQGVYRWSNSLGAQGVLNRDFIYQADFAEAACTPLAPAEPGLINEAARKLNEWLSAPGDGKLIIYRNGGPGVRG